MCNGGHVSYPGNTIYGHFLWPHLCFCPVITRAEVTNAVVKLVTQNGNEKRQKGGKVILMCDTIDTSRIESLSEYTNVQETYKETDPG